MPSRANTELVAIAFLSSLPGVPAGKVATTLPQDASTWQADGFVQVTTAGGDPHLDVPLRRSIVQVDAWANAAGSSRPPWGKAAHLLELILTAMYDPGTYPATVALPTGYPGARVLSAYPVTESRRIPDPAAGYARYSVDMAMHWIQT